MNIPLALETATAETLRTYATLTTGVRIRTWQRLQNDGSIDKDGSREFPLVDIRCGTPMTDENQVTLSAVIEILCATLNDDDRQHNVIRELYQGVQETIDNMYAQFRNTDGSELTSWLAAVATETDNAFQFGGFSFEQGLAPFDDSGRNTIGISLRVHFSRADY